jgi:hypothetical protein
MLLIGGVVLAIGVVSVLPLLRGSSVRPRGIA